MFWIFNISGLVLILVGCVAAFRGAPFHVTYGSMLTGNAFLAISNLIAENYLWAAIQGGVAVLVLVVWVLLARKYGPDAA